MDLIQQYLFRRLCRNQKKVPDEFMIIKGKVLTSVNLKDIGRRIAYNQEISLNELEVNKSKDLQNAIRRSWVDVTYDRGMIQRALTVPSTESTEKMSNQINETDMLDMAKKMARSMAEEMIKNSPLVKEMAKEIANEMVIGIKDNLNIVVQGNFQQQKINVPESNIFVDFKDEEVGLKASINNIGTVEVQKDDDLTTSLEKMKRFKPKG